MLREPAGAGRLGGAARLAAVAVASHEQLGAAVAVDVPEEEAALVEVATAAEAA